jgi:hypothetical protein
MGAKYKMCHDVASLRNILCHFVACLTSILCSEVACLTSILCSEVGCLIGCTVSEVCTYEGISKISQTDAIYASVVLARIIGKWKDYHV